MSEKKTKAKRAASTPGDDEFGKISTKADLRNFLMNIRDKMTEEVAAPIYSLSAMNYIMNLPNIYDLLNKENKEIARDIWLRLRQSGVQLKSPPLLFSAEEESAMAG